MNFFRSAEPLLRPKQEALDFQDLKGLWRINWQIGDSLILSRFYTRIDQIFVIWGLVTAVIFATAQFFPISWATQALIWTGLTLLATVSMAALAWFWVAIERLRWVVYCWAGLMLLGVALTDLGIFGGWWPILMYLCPLWLGLCAIGYVCTGFGMQSRTFVLMGLIHLSGIPLLQSIPNYQFLITGLIMSGSLLLLSEVQWDMRPPIEFAMLTDAQRAFNEEQYRRRQLVSISVER
jgi:hypothetical protein